MDSCWEQAWSERMSAGARGSPAHIANLLEGGGARVLQQSHGMRAKCCVHTCSAFITTNLARSASCSATCFISTAFMNCVHLGGREGTVGVRVMRDE